MTESGHAASRGLRHAARATAFGPMIIAQAASRVARSAVFRLLSLALALAFAAPPPVAAEPDATQPPVEATSESTGETVSETTNETASETTSEAANHDEKKSPAAPAAPAADKNADKGGDKGGDKDGDKVKLKSNPDYDAAIAKNWKDRVVLVPVHGAIVGRPISAGGMVERVLEAIKKADGDGAKRLIIEVDSPGGAVADCNKIALALAACEVPTTALVIHQAISGGAMVSLGCAEIVLCDAARIGDIQPMQYSPGGQYVEMSPHLREKVETDLRTVLRTIARKRNRPAEVVNAMVTLDIELYRVTYEDGSVEYLNKPAFELKQKEIDAGREPRKVRENKLVSRAGELLTLATDEALEFGIADSVVKDKDTFLRERGLDPADIVEVPVGKAEFGLGASLDGLFDDMDLPDWAKMVLLVFLVMGIAGLLVEYNMPGFGVPGVCSIIGWVGFFSILMMHDRGSWLGIFLFILGVALLVVEIAILPGFGVAGIAGAACVLLGLFLAYAPKLDGSGLDWFTVPAGADYSVLTLVLGEFFLLFALGVLGAGLATWLFFSYGKHLPGAGALFMAETVDSPDSPTYAVGRTIEDHAREEARRQSWLGMAGVAETPLRPSGKVRLADGERLDVVSDGEVLDAGTPVRVISVSDNRVVVERRD